MIDVIPGDNKQYAFMFLVTVALQYSCFAVAYLCEFDLITDFAGSMNFVLIAVLSLYLGGTFFPRQIVVTAMLCTTRVYLALYLFYRVCKRKSDGRFDKIRGSFCKFMGFWTYQIFWVYLVALPVQRINVSPNDVPLSPLDYIGWTLWTFGFVVQVSADLQKLSFRADPANKLKICKRGFWRYSRHPNYYGEMLMFWGLTMSGIPLWTAAGNGEADGWVSVLSPIFTMFVLLFLSGVPMAEGKALKKYYTNGDELTAEYEEYRSGAPPVIICCPPLYRALPSAIKVAFCCEYDRYIYSPESDNAVPLASQENTATAEPKKSPV